MRVIISADDFGYSEDTVRATIESLEAGALTAASLMANMPATGQAVAYAKANPSMSFGVHLCFASGTTEAPVLPPHEIPALVTPNGLFRSTNAIRAMALCNGIPMAQIEAEASAQIASLMEKGVRISHVDSHSHLHKLPLFREALRRVLPKFGIARVRNVQDIYTDSSPRRSTYWLGTIWRRGLMRSFVTTQHFFMDPAPSRANDWPDEILARVRDGTLEVGVHPGYAEEWRNQERLRIHRFADNARRAGHELIPWTAL